MDQVCLLGTKGGAAIRPGSAMPTSSLLTLGGRHLIVDCGLGVSQAIIKQGVSLTQIDAIVITHLHADHFLELGPLLHTAWLAGLKQPIDVYGPAGLAGYWAGWLQAMSAEIATREADEGRPRLSELVRFTPTCVGDIEIGDHWRLSAQRNTHPPLDDSFAYVVERGGRRVGFSGNTAYDPALARLFRRVDLLVHEAMLVSALEALQQRLGHADHRLMQHWLRGHTRAVDVGRLACDSEAAALALHHLIPADDPSVTDADWLAEVQVYWPGPTTIGRDGLCVPVRASR